MTSISRKLIQTIAVLCLQISSSLSVPLLQPVIQAQPQIMMHTLQQPIPMKTFETHLKTQPLDKPMFQGIPMIQGIPMLQNIPMIQGIPNLQLLQNIPSFQEIPTMQEIQALQGMSQEKPIQQGKPMSALVHENHLQQGIPMSQGMQKLPEIPDPMLIPAMQQMQGDLEQQIVIQQQLMALQQLQGLQAGLSPMTRPQQPILILLPDEKTSSDDNNLFKTIHDHKHDTEHQGYEDEELDSVVIDEPNNDKKGMRKAILIVPNARISIGGLISTIPWLPIEINVPDSIAWAWNGITSGISSIISIIGSRLPFVSRPQTTASTDPSVKMFLQSQMMNNYPTMPIYVMPIGGVVPLQN